MAYFPNGTAGECYESEYCARCLHNPTTPEHPGCAVMLAHLLHNYEEESRPVLNVLIPMDGIEAKECSMFVDRALFESDDAFGLTLLSVANDGSCGSPQARLDKIKALVGLRAKSQKPERETEVM